MADLKPTVALTNVNMETLSRKELLEWVNTTTNGNYGKIEQLCSGIAFCKIMEQLFPNCIGVKKIKTNAKLDHEYLHNLRLLQTAFTRLKFDKTVPIEKLMKGKFQDNFEFLQWFKKFYDSNYLDKPKENIVHDNAFTKLQLGDKKLSNPDLLDKEKKHMKGSISPASLRTLQNEIDTMEKRISAAAADRDFFYKKLTAIESILNRAVADNTNVEWCKQVFAALYATNNNIDEEPKLI